MCTAPSPVEVQDPSVNFNVAAVETEKGKPVEMVVTSQALGWQVPKDRKGMVGLGSYDDTLNALEGALKPGPYVCGAQFTAADVYVGSQLGWGMMFGMLEKRPVFADYVARVYARPAAQRASQINEARKGA